MNQETIESHFIKHRSALLDLSDNEQLDGNTSMIVHARVIRASIHKMDHWRRQRRALGERETMLVRQQLLESLRRQFEGLPLEEAFHVACQVYLSPQVQAIVDAIASRPPPASKMDSDSEEERDSMTVASIKNEVDDDLFTNVWQTSESPSNPSSLTVKTPLTLKAEKDLVDEFVDVRLADDDDSPSTSPTDDQMPPNSGGRSPDDPWSPLTGSVPNLDEDGIELRNLAPAPIETQNLKRRRSRAFTKSPHSPISPVSPSELPNQKARIEESQEDEEDQLFGPKSPKHDGDENPTILSPNTLIAVPILIQLSTGNA